MAIKPTDAIRAAIGNTLGDALHRSVCRQPQASALYFQGRDWSYRALDAAANRVARGLLDAGLVKGDRVAAYGKNSDAYVLLWLGCLRAGLIHVPINYALVRDELAYICNQSGAAALFCDDDLLANVQALADSVDLRVLGSLRAAQAGAQARALDILTLATSAGDDSPPLIEIADDDPAQMLYTSGTTSAPKGAVHTHRSLLAEYVGCLLHLDTAEEDRSLAALPLYHSAQMHCFVMPGLLRGAFSYLIETPQPDEVLEIIERERITSFFAPPTVWIGLLRHDDFDTRDLASLQKLYYGASIMPEPIVAELAQRLPEGRLYNCYGQSEIAPLATVLAPHEHVAGRLSSCGRPLTTVQTRIVRPGTLEDCDVGEHGEILHRSPQLMIGYWDKPEQTAEAFEGGWFHSGDMAYRDADGFMFIVDRIKDVVNTGGVLVASREVEEALYTHPAIAEVAVIGVPHEKWVEAVVAVAVLKPDSETSAEELVDHARDKLAGFKLPKAVHFVEELPKNTAGKLLKRELRTLFGEVS